MERLGLYLHQTGISQAEFADSVGVKQPTVWEWINGHSKPSVDSLLKISEITELSIDELLKEPAA